MINFCDVPRTQIGNYHPYCISKMYVYPTYACNTSCVHCWQSRGPSETLEPEVLRKTLKSLSCLPRAIVFLGGEVSLLPDELEEYLRICDEFAIPASVQSNLLEVSDQMFTLYKKLGKVSTSFEPGRYSSKQHQQFITNCQKLKDAGIRITAIGVMTDAWNRTSVDELIDIYYTQIPADSIVFLPEAQVSERTPQTEGALRKNREFIDLYARSAQHLYYLYHALPMAWRLKTQSFTQHLNEEIPELKATLLCEENACISISPRGTIHLGAVTNNYPAFTPEDDDYDLLPQLIAQAYSMLKDHPQPRCANCEDACRCLPRIQFPFYSMTEYSGECMFLRSLRRSLMKKPF